ncbi:hypothetical protein B7463_g3416, partial [Scytalidium lignicola]
MSNKIFASRAIVTHEPRNGQHRFEMQDLTLRPQLQPDELIVHIIASGVCHTDLVFAKEPAYSPTFPRILGHEGAGYVREAGDSVNVAKVGDAVLLSFSFCSKCRNCKTEHPAYCQQFNELNYVGEVDIFQSKKGPAPSGSFFGQSSFSNFTIVKQTSVVNVNTVIKNEYELKLFAPLGCGFQTGMGTVDHFAGAGKADTVAAKIKGALTIIGVDQFESRLGLAKEFGATHVLNTSSTGFDLVAAIKSLTDGFGSSITVDTTGNVGLISKGMDFTGKRGQMILLGVAPLTAELPVNLITFMQSGKSFRGNIEGDVTPSKYIPKMIQWYHDGRFQIEKLVKFYKADNFEMAFEDMKSGSTIKPILLW